jgi:hypothetical protein
VTTAVIVDVNSLPQQVGAYTQPTELAMVRWPLTHLRGDQDISATDAPGWIETVSTTALRYSRHLAGRNRFPRPVDDA